MNNEHCARIGFRARNVFGSFESQTYKDVAAQLKLLE